eukprot:6141226-Prymnesium_polylepis.2
MCDLPRDYRKGGIFPGALNYDPSAVQPADCFYQVRGSHCPLPVCQHWCWPAAVACGYLLWQIAMTFLCASMLLLTRGHHSCDLRCHLRYLCQSVGGCV